jgi:hypothetical protein
MASTIYSGCGLVGNSASRLRPVSGGEAAMLYYSGYGSLSHPEVGVSPCVDACAHRPYMRSLP